MSKRAKDSFGQRITIRVTNRMIERAARVRPRVVDDPDFASVTAGRDSISAALRVALHYGLECLQRKYAAESRWRDKDT